jgi:hypothetical protein
MEAKTLYAEKIKEILVNLAVEDKLPLDLTTLDSEVFEEVFTPLITTLKTLREDAEMALGGQWDKTDSGFEAQLTLIDMVI